jgi:hypothetical protein
MVQSHVKEQGSLSLRGNFPVVENTGSANLQNDDPLETSIPAASLESILCTEELLLRPAESACKISSTLSASVCRPCPLFLSSTPTLAREGEGVQQGEPLPARHPRRRMQPESWACDLP